MNKKEIFQYIIDKKIPLMFIWENNIEYYLELESDNYFTSGNLNEVCKDFTFPNFNKIISSNNKISYLCEGSNTYNRNYYYMEKDTFEECLSHFLFWFELNKGSFKNIVYYENSSNNNIN